MLPIGFPWEFLESTSQVFVLVIAALVPFFLPETPRCLGSKFAFSAYKTRRCTDAVPDLTRPALWWFGAHVIVVAVAIHTQSARKQW